MRPVLLLSGGFLLVWGATAVGECQPRADPGPSPLVRSITTLTLDGGRLSWSESLNRIAFDRAGSDGYFDIWTMNPDGSDQVCLTCDRPGFPSRHIGNPTWHPLGAYLAFQAQKPTVTGLGIDFFANPGSGLNNDLYMMDSPGQNAWRLSNVPIGPGGVLHPQFSRDGRLLLWAERVADGGRFGQWIIRLADFRVERGIPQVDNIRTFTPGAQQRFYETHGFSPDDGTILFSGKPDQGLDEFGMDIYRFAPSSGALTNLTATPGEWDEHAHFSPRGDRIVWMASRGFGPIAAASELRAEFWIMNPDGSNKRKLTNFNQAGSAEFIAGQAVAADSDWSLDGTRIAAYVITNPQEVRGRIVMIELDPQALAASEPAPSANTGTPQTQ